MDMLESSTSPTKAKFHRLLFCFDGDFQMYENVWITLKLPSLIESEREENVNARKTRNRMEFDQRSGQWPVCRSWRIFKLACIAWALNSKPKTDILFDNIKACYHSPTQTMNRPISPECRSVRAMSQVDGIFFSCFAQFWACTKQELEHCYYHQE